MYVYMYAFLSCFLVLCLLILFSILSRFCLFAFLNGSVHTFKHQLLHPLTKQDNGRQIFNAQLIIILTLYIVILTPTYVCMSKHVYMYVTSAITTTRKRRRQAAATAMVRSSPTSFRRNSPSRHATAPVPVHTYICKYSSGFVWSFWMYLSANVAYSLWLIRGFTIETRRPFQ